MQRCLLQSCKCSDLFGPEPDNDLKFRPGLKSPKFGVLSPLIFGEDQKKEISAPQRNHNFSRKIEYEVISRRCCSLGGSKVPSVRLLPKGKLDVFSGKIYTIQRNQSLQTSKKWPWHNYPLSRAATNRGGRRAAPPWTKMLPPKLQIDNRRKCC